MATQNNHVYQDFEPTTEWVRDDAFDTLLIHLSGFKKEQLKVQVTSARNLRVFGECSSGDKRCRFKKNFQIPPQCDTNQISAKFEGNILKIKYPKIESIKPQDSLAKSSEINQKQETINELKGDQKGTAQEQTLAQKPHIEQKEELVEAGKIDRRNESKLLCFKDGFCDLVMQTKMPTKSTKMVVAAAGLVVLVLGLYVTNTTCRSEESRN